MPFDFAQSDTRKHRGRTAYHDGLAAEGIVLRDYQQRGYRLLEERWRGRFGEIDLIFAGCGELVFVEVKKSKSHEAALERLRETQLLRIAQSAEDYIARFAKEPLTPMRLDLAAVDKAGEVSIVEGLTLY